ncbi:hypothetical protein [Burkholderia phage vB_BpP_HN04]|uniref:Uncharacterized protein n=1 Tax=Burkholderia phage vB_BpP_HN02 TaxID=3116925 RepID=A0AAX4JIZ3_9CAUD|nr:hypothetical protein [Burkholderia phage vB_BpP_HN01]
MSPDTSGQWVLQRPDTKEYWNTGHKWYLNQAAILSGSQMEDLIGSFPFLVNAYHITGT